MPSNYLQDDDAAAYGVPKASPAQIQHASLMIDAYCQRPEGLVYAVDSTGTPAWMPGATPTLSAKLAAPIAAGTNVTAQLIGVPNFPQDWIGEVVLLDSATANLAEVCVVSGLDPTGRIPVLQSVLNAHGANATADFGMVCCDEVALPAGRSIARLARANPVRLLSGMGRYSYGRRSSQAEGYIEEFNLLAAVSNFGGPPLWQPWDVTKAGLSTITSEVWVPAGILLAYFSEVRVRYVAGFAQANLPPGVKQACANIAQSLSDIPMSSLVKTVKTGGVSLQRFTDTMIDDETRRLLSPYIARMFR